MPKNSAAGRAKAKGKPSAMPPPLGGGGAARKGKKAGAKAAAFDGTPAALEAMRLKAEREVTAMLKKANGYIDDWEKCDKASLTAEKDKGYFRNLANLTSSMQQRSEGAEGSKKACRLKVTRTFYPGTPGRIRMNWRWTGCAKFGCPANGRHKHSSAD